MDYRCSLCGEVIHEDLTIYINHTEKHIVDVIRKQHPEWIETNGICKECYEYYKSQLAGQAQKPKRRFFCLFRKKE